MESLDMSGYMAKDVRLSTATKMKESREGEDRGMGRIILLHLIEPSVHRGPFLGGDPRKAAA